MSRLTKYVTAEEGVRLKPYLDHLGVLTIGVGRNLDHKGISAQEAEWLLENDLRECEDDLDGLFGRYFLDFQVGDARRAALIGMRFQLGGAGFRGFRKMISAIDREDWDTAADEALDSRWAQQTPERARRVARMFLTNRFIEGYGG